MAVTLGFIVVFAAGLAGAYFAGVQAAKSRTPALPVQRNPKPRTIESDPESATPAVASPAAANCVAPVATESSGSAADESWKDGNETGDSEFCSETRRFKRSAFSGTAVATIYPPKSQSSDEPLRCEVLTRDLCRGGVGIAHTERLVPQQMVVLEAFGKLLVSEVCWCQRVDKGLYIAGCRLIKAT